MTRVVGLWAPERRFNRRRYSALLAEAAPRVITSCEELERATKVVEPLLKKGERRTLEENGLCQLVLKLIDDYPENAQRNAWNPDSGPPPGEYAKSLNGYELPIAMEVRRGRYNRSYERPRPLRPNQPEEFVIPLRSHDHVFLKGHRIMVQVQSTWFPVIDRNPQNFVPNIYEARANDYVVATQRIYTSRVRPSHIVLPVSGASGT